MEAAGKFQFQFEYPVGSMTQTSALFKTKACCVFKGMKKPNNNKGATLMALIGSVCYMSLQFKGVVEAFRDLLPEGKGPSGQTSKNQQYVPFM